MSKKPTPRKRTRKSTRKVAGNKASPTHATEAPIKNAIAISPDLSVRDGNSTFVAAPIIELTPAQSSVYIWLAVITTHKAIIAFIVMTGLMALTTIVFGFGIISGRISISISNPLIGGIGLTSAAGTIVGGFVLYKRQKKPSANATGLDQPYALLEHSTLTRESSAGTNKAAPGGAPTPP